MLNEILKVTREDNNMRTLFLVFLFIHSLGIFAQTNSDQLPKEYLKAKDNTFEKIYFPQYISITNVINPFGTQKNNESWRDWYKSSAWKDLTPYIKTYISPHLKNIQITDDDIFSITIWYNLNGEAAYIEYNYPTKLDIPINAIELLETTLKENAMITISPISKHKEGIYYIQRIANTWLKDIQEEQ